MKRKWLFIVNSTAGGGKTGKKINHLVNALNKHDLAYDIELTKAPGHATDLAKEAVLNAYANIISVGGDGTLNEIVNGIMLSGNHGEVTLGVLPEGAGNDFSNNFKIPSHIEHALNILERQHKKKIDIGMIEDKYFINSCGLGFDAKVAKFANNIKWLNGLPRYILAVVKALFDGIKFDARVILDNDEFNVPFLLIAIGNGRSAGGGFYLTPEARTDDGLLDICFIKEVSRTRILKLLPSAIKGKHLREPEVCLRQTKKLIIRSEQNLPIYFDGEIPELNNPRDIQIEIIPSAIDFIC